jgi:hypothetical protein
MLLEILFQYYPKNCRGANTLAYLAKEMTRNTVWRLEETKNTSLKRIAWDKGSSLLAAMKKDIL